MSIHHGIRIYIIQHNLIYFENIITQYMTYIYIRLTLYLSGKDTIKFSQALWFSQINAKIFILVQVMKHRFDRIIS